MIAQFFLRLYFLVHGTLGLPGAGWLIRRMVRFVPGLRACPMELPGVGTAVLDFRDEAMFALVNLRLGDFGNHGHLLALMERCLPPGAVLWDVGANVGFVSGHFAHPSHRLGAVHAFEPSPGPLRVLETLFQNHPPARVHPFGLGERNEQLVLRATPASSSNSSLHRELKDAVDVPIAIRRGDDVRRELSLPAPDVLKVDVEGFEPQVFAGLRETLAACRPVIFFEHIMLSDEQLRQLRPPDCELLFILDDGRLTEDFALRMQGHDAIFLPREKSHLLPRNMR